MSNVVVFIDSVPDWCVAKPNRFVANDFGIDQMNGHALFQATDSPPARVAH